MLSTIQSPADVRRLSPEETEALAGEIRQDLIRTIAKTGGHLASNLGAVELTLALHRALDTPTDKIIFDVGHQSYTHKIITGRRDRLPTIRREGGLSGFPKRTESEYDVFETGHASTALSGAVGMARARDAQGEDYAIAVLLGDGALTGGMCYEALNDAGSRPTQLIVLLNDNEMSIAHNVGALSKHLTQLRSSPQWLSAKKTVKRGLYRFPGLGKPLAKGIEWFKRVVRVTLVPGEFFEALGFGYLGPIDGHDIQTLERVLKDARSMQRPVVVHAVTQKGHGYTLAESQPEKFHGTPPFLVKSGAARVRAQAKVSDEVSACDVINDALAGLAAENPKIMAVTAAMPHGTGLLRFAKAYPDRFFDVGIAEEHAMTLAAGMAAGGMRPVFAVYATFLQRAVDQLMHDVCLQGLPVVVLVEHAGFVAGDGETHQGVYDLAMIRALPNLTIWSPADEKELRAMLAAAFTLDGPCVIRYPKALPRATDGENALGSWRCVQDGTDAQIVTYGQTLKTALTVAEMLREKGYACAVWNASTLQPLDTAALGTITACGGPVAVLEEAQVHGGLGEAVAGYYASTQAGVRVLMLGVPGIAPGAHSLAGLARECGLDAKTVAGQMEEALHGGQGKA